MKKYFAVAIAVIAVIALASGSFASCGMCGDGNKAAEKAVSAAPEKVNNTICPVTGQPVDMKSPVTVEYKGKIYNFCCPACVKPFINDPEKYISKIKK